MYVLQTVVDDDPYQITWNYLDTAYKTGLNAET